MQVNNKIEPLQQENRLVELNEGAAGDKYVNVVPLHLSAPHNISPEGGAER